MIYSKRDGWYFVHVPKCAGTAILRRYARIGNQSGGNSELTEKKIETNRKELGYSLMPYDEHTHHNKASFFSQVEELKGLAPLAILRNPWSRCLSIYLYQLKISQANLGQIWADIDHPILIKQGFKGSWMEGGFFVDGHAKHVEYNTETKRSWASNDDQASWLEGVQSARWFRLEDMLKDFCYYTEMPIPEKFNTTQKADYRHYYDDELRERINQLFKRDVALGHYEF